MNQTNPFKVPQNYFEEMPREVMDKLPPKVAQSKRKVQIWGRLLPWAAVAAVLCVLVSVLTQMPNINRSNKMHLNKVVATVSPTSKSTNDDDFYNYIQDESVKNVYQNDLYAEE